MDTGFQNRFYIIVVNGDPTQNLVLNKSYNNNVDHSLICQLHAASKKLGLCNGAPGLPEILKPVLSFIDHSEVRTRNLRRLSRHNLIITIK